MSSQEQRHIVMQRGVDAAVAEQMMQPMLEEFAQAITTRMVQMYHSGTFDTDLLIGYVGYLGAITDIGERLATLQTQGIVARQKELSNGTPS
jgi:hypothetical protein